MISPVIPVIGDVQEAIGEMGARAPVGRGAGVEKQDAIHLLIHRLVAVPEDDAVRHP